MVQKYIVREFQYQHFTKFFLNRCMLLTWRQYATASVYKITIGGLHKFVMNYVGRIKQILYINVELARNQ